MSFYSTFSVTHRKKYDSLNSSSLSHSNFTLIYLHHILLKIDCNIYRNVIKQSTIKRTLNSAFTISLSILRLLILIHSLKYSIELAKTRLVRLSEGKLALKSCAIAFRTRLIQMGFHLIMNNGQGTKPLPQMHFRR